MTTKLSSIFKNQCTWERKLVYLLTFSFSIKQSPKQLDELVQSYILQLEYLFLKDEYLSKTWPKCLEMLHPASSKYRTNFCSLKLIEHTMWIFEGAHHQVPHGRWLKGHNTQQEHLSNRGMILLAIAEVGFIVVWTQLIIQFYCMVLWSSFQKSRVMDKPHGQNRQKIFLLKSPSETCMLGC